MWTAVSIEHDVLRCTLTAIHYSQSLIYMSSQTNTPNPNPSLQDAVIARRILAMQGQATRSFREQVLD